MTARGIKLPASAGVHNPRPNGPLGSGERAIPPWRFPEPRTSTCMCGHPIRESCFGWIHVESVWTTLGECRQAAPKFGRTA